LIPYAGSEQPGPLLRRPPEGAVRMLSSPRRSSASSHDDNSLSTFAPSGRVRRQGICGYRCLVYEFLLKAHGSPKQARADFVSYLSGELPARLLKEARLWVAEEQGCKAPTLIDEDDLVEQLPGNSSLIPQAQSKSQYSTNSGQLV
jgi:hypothetical protein